MVNTGPCTFSVDVSNADNGDPPSALDSSTSTLSECQTKCNDVTKCEYIVYSATTTTCYLYASKPYGAPPETGTSTGYTRECYTGINGNYNINHGANSGRLPALTACENVTFSTAGERAETTVVTRARTEPPTTTSALSTVPASTTATMSPTSISTSTSTSSSTSSSTLESTAISGTSRLPIGTTTTDALRQAITSAVFRSTQSNPASATGATTGLSTNSATGATTGRSANSATGATTGLSTNSATGATTGRSANSATGATTESSGNSMTGSTSAQNSIEMWPNSTLPSSVNAPLSDSPSTCCHCLKPDMTPEEKGAFTESILARLSLNTRTTSAHVRTLTSASDSRISATAVGCTGLVFLTIVFGGIVLLDLGRLVSDLKMFKNNLKELLHSK
ncbi:serine-rich adhesin for platelets-like [Liolophura sinensis]|uniref:serine-rich adhesin for platelets-like n=1 Tax=Liolophura sinensis TaxID=3198878 RepID=UPI0031591067